VAILWQSNPFPYTLGSYPSTSEIKVSTEQTQLANNFSCRNNAKGATRDNVLFI